MEKVLVNGYAKALFELAEERHISDDITKDLALFNEVLESNPSYYQLLTHPLINKREKQALVKQLFINTLNSTTISYIGVLLAHNRISFYRLIASQYTHLVRSARGIKLVVIESAQALDEQQTKKLKQVIMKRFECDIETKIIINPALLAGLKIKIDDQYIDMNVKNQLAKIKNAVLHHENEVNG